MQNNRDTTARVVLVAAGVAIVCSLAVSIAVSYFRSVQTGSASLDWQRDVVDAAGLAESSAGIVNSDLAARYGELTLRFVDLQTGLLSASRPELPADWDPVAESQVDNVPKDQDIARIGERPRLMPAYFVGDPRAPTRVVLPVYGQGMWSTIHAFVGFDPDSGTIISLVIHEHAETPGIGDRIEDEAWLSRWQGQPPAATDVDAISGATVTTASVIRLVQFWLGPAGYGPFLQQLRATSEQ